MTILETRWRFTKKILNTFLVVIAVGVAEAKPVPPTLPKKRTSIARNNSLSTIAPTNKYKQASRGNATQMQIGHAYNRKIECNYIRGAIRKPQTRRVAQRRNERDAVCTSEMP